LLHPSKCFGILANIRKIISKAVSSVEYVYSAKGKVAEAVVGAYVDGLWCSHAVSLTFSLLALAISFLLREHKL
jgi:hypothetical protein